MIIRGIAATPGSPIAAAGQGLSDGCDHASVRRGLPPLGVSLLKKVPLAPLRRGFLSAGYGRLRPR